MKHLNESEQRHLHELLEGDSLDDSPHGDHQARLRAQVLEVFDHARSDGVPSKQRVIRSHEKPTIWTRQSLACVAALAVCVMVLVSIRLFDGDGLDTPAVVHQQPFDMTDDQQLLASLSTLDAFRDEVSRDEYFAAIAMCQHDHEARAMSGIEHQ